jgi:excisionase family DNA binding protein
MNEEPKQNIEPELLTPDELAALLNMSIKFVKNHIQSRRIPGLVKCGRHWRIKRVEVEKRIISGKLLLDI